MKIKELITDHMDIWISAQTPKANGGRGRGSNSNGQGHYGIKKLRELILELAVRGKLVPQDPKDKPASVLLEKIAQEKKRLINEGKIKKQDALPGIGDGEKLFKLPLGWVLERFGNVTFNRDADRIPISVDE
jgi:type I restriction enzyme S subunit